jgi:hypothetical protein
MEKWLADNWYWFLSIVGAMFVAYWRIGKLEDDVKEHLDKDNSAPHPACPVHGVKFNELISSITEVKNSVAKLDNRIYEFMRSNGYHDREAGQ